MNKSDLKNKIVLSPAQGQVLNLILPSFKGRPKNALAPAIAADTKKKDFRVALMRPTGIPAQGGPKGPKNKLSVNPFLINVSRMGRLAKKVDSNTRNLLNEYQSQFKAKQALKEFYGDISETQLKILFAKQKNKGSLICVLERRLDVVVFRLGFSHSIWHARNLIKTNQIKVNNQIIKNPNFLISNGSQITTLASSSSFISKLLHLNLNQFKLPSHLYYISSNSTLTKFNLLENSKLGGIFLKDPLEAEIILPNNLALDKFNYYIKHRYPHA